MVRISAGILTVSFLFVGCVAGGASRATVDSAPPPPPPPPETEADAPPTEPEDRSEADAADSTVAEPAVEPLAAAPGYPPAVLIGARVADVRTDPLEIVVEVGDSLAMGEDVEMIAYDAAGNPVRGVRILGSIESRFAALEEGHIMGVSEGEAELRMAIRVPPPGGTGPPEIRTFTAPLSVVGPPVTSVEIVDPEVRFFTGSMVQIEARALTEDGSVRKSVEVAWTSNRRRLATIDSRGFVRAIRPGAVTVTAAVEGLEATYSFEVEENPVAAVELDGPSRGRTGDVLRFAAAALDADGDVVEGTPVDFSVSSFETRADMGASVYPDGAFVAERPGLYRVTANAGARTGQVLVEVVERGVEHEVIVTGHGLVADRPTSDLWAFTGVDGRDYVYTGTHLGGQRMLAWDVTNPASPVLTDFVEVDARVVNDVKVNSSATVAVITREGASDRRNGIVVLDITDPAHPAIADTYTDELTGGVHNVFFSGDILYAIHNGTLDVHILDISDPTDVEEVGRWGIDAPGKYLHDIWVVDGLAYVSYWNDGVYILDVGDGRWGGTPTEPVEVSSFAYEEGNTHFAYPYTNADGHRYLFVGDEIFGCEDCISRNGHPGDGSRGFVHILDLEDPENLREVARYEVPEAGAHNLWIEDDRMYVAYYQAGLRVVDVSGELRGDLYRQGREMAWFPTGTPEGHVPNSPMAWGPQPFKGHVFVSDLNSGLWVVRLEPKQKAPVS
ncbi:MAG: Ig-like domain-containing protein [Gemmatimonadota bacterium]|nr:Ig-like domain-containing protein [Gemmatimonadota bacterium]